MIVGETRPLEEWATEAATVIQQLTAETVLSATTVRADGTPSPTAMANNLARGWYTALLWNPATVTPVAGGFRPYGAPDFWHGFTTMRFDIGSVEPVTVASYHGDPFRGNWRRDEAFRIKSAFRTTGGAKPGLVLGDFNALSAAKADGPECEQYYDPEPYLDQDHDDLEYQLLEGTIGTTQLADRRQSEVLLRRARWDHDDLARALVKLRPPRPRMTVTRAVLVDQEQAWRDKYTWRVIAEVPLGGRGART